MPLLPISRWPSISSLSITVSQVPPRSVAVVASLPIASPLFSLRLRPSFAAASEVVFEEKTLQRHPTSSMHVLFRFFLIAWCDVLLFPHNCVSSPCQLSWGLGLGQKRSFKCSRSNRCSLFLDKSFARRPIPRVFFFFDNAPR